MVSDRMPNGYFQAFNYNKNPRHPGILLEVDGTAWQPHHASHCPAVSGGAIGDLVTTMMRDREIGIGAEVAVVTAVTVVTEIEVTVTAVIAVIAVIAEGIGATVTVATAIAVIGATVAVIEKGTTGTTGRTETRATLVMTPELQKASPEMVEDHGPLMAFPGRVKPLARLAMPMRTPTSEFKMQGLRRMKPRPL